MMKTKTGIQVEYDLKRLLLGDRYDQSEPIRNVLLAKFDAYYADDVRDYHENYQAHMRGHIENYAIVSETLAPFSPSGEVQHYDVMHSFWTTYKCFLQLAYPEIFMPSGRINGPAPLGQTSGKEKPQMAYPPYSLGGKNQYVPGKYVAYYHTHFPNLRVDSTMTWVAFLLENFSYFDKVHDHAALNTFAGRTHTIGNMTCVPKGFNVGRKGADYWDLALRALPLFLTDAQSFEEQVATYCYEGSFEETGRIKPLWEGHLDSGANQLPQTLVHIEAFLHHVNTHIMQRGKRLLSARVA